MAKNRVAVAGVGYTGFNSTTPGMQWKELMFEASRKACRDAGLDARKDIDSFLTCAEDYWEGFSIFDEFVPDQIGAILRPCGTVCADGIYGLGNAYMQIKTGQFDTVLVEAHSKASDMLTYNDIVTHAMDPIWNKPVMGEIERGREQGGPWGRELEEELPTSKRSHPYFLAGLEMQNYLNKTETTEEQCAEVVRKNKSNAFENPSACYEADLTVEDVLNSEYLFRPLKRLEISQLVDGGIVFILTSEKIAKTLTDDVVYLDGFGWSSETPWLETRGMEAKYCKLAAKMAYDMARVERPKERVDVVEVDDRFAYKELQHLEALGLASEGEAGHLVQEGALERDGSMPVNVSGGSLGVGNLLEATGLQKSLEIYLQLKGRAGKRQVSDVELGVAQSWRGVPTASGVVAVFSRGT